MSTVATSNRRVTISRRPAEALASIRRGIEVVAECLGDGKRNGVGGCQRSSQRPHQNQRGDHIGQVDHVAPREHDDVATDRQVGRRRPGRCCRATRCRPGRRPRRTSHRHRRASPAPVGRARTASRADRRWPCRRRRGAARAWRTWHRPAPSARRRERRPAPSRPNGGRTGHRLRWRKRISRCGSAATPAANPAVTAMS